MDRRDATHKPGDAEDHRVPFRDMDRLELRPLTIGEILDASFKLFTANLRKLLPLAAVILVPIGILQLVLTAQLGTDFSFLDAAVTDTPNPDVLLAPLGRVLGLAAATAILSLVGSLLVQAGAIRLYADLYQGRETSWQESLSFGVSRFGPVLVASLLAALGVGVGLLFYLVPGVWLYVSWWVAIPALLVERLGPIQALGRSFGLVRRRFWATAGAAALTFLIVYVVQQIIGTLVSVAVLVPTFGADAPNLGPALAISSAAQTVVNLFTVPFLAAAATVVYFELRVRNEGYDLEVMAAELGDEGPPPPAAPSDEDPFGLDRP